MPANAKFTDTNTWRNIQDNLNSTSTTESLSANQGRILNEKISSSVTVKRVLYPNDINVSNNPYAAGTTSFNYDFSNAIPNGYNFLFGIWFVAWYSGNNNGVVVAWNYQIVVDIKGTQSVNGVGVYRSDISAYHSLTFRPGILLFFIKK